MKRKKLLSFILAASMVAGSAMMVYADGEDGTVSSSSAAEESAEAEEGTDETQGEETETSDSAQESTGESTEEVQNGSTGESTGSETIGSSDSSSAASDTAADTSYTGTETADDSAVQDAANQAANESQAPQETVGTPGVAAPDLSWVSPDGIITSSTVITASEEEDADGLSDSVREDYQKIDPVYAIARKDTVTIYEDKSRESRAVGTIQKGGVMHVLKVKAGWFYVESENVRGYVRIRDVIYGDYTESKVAAMDLSQAAKAEEIVPLEENAAADDYGVTVYQFNAASGEDVIAYAREHLGAKYQEEGTSWDTGFDNDGFINQVYSFYQVGKSQEEADYTTYGLEVASLEEAQAGDLLILDNGSLALYTGAETVILCSDEEIVIEQETAEESEGTDPEQQEEAAAQVENTQQAAETEGTGENQNQTAGQQDAAAEQQAEVQSQEAGRQAENAEVQTQDEQQQAEAAEVQAAEQTEAQPAAEQTAEAQPILTKKLGVTEKSIHDVMVTAIRRPDYEAPFKETVEDGLVGDTVEEQVWNYLTKNLGLSDTAAAGAMGNMKAECGFQTGNLENWVNALMNCSDEQFTAAVDTGVYTLSQFLDDKYTYPTSGNGSQWGYGLIGFTSRSAKTVLWANTVAMGRSLSDLRGQLDAVAQIYGEKLFWVSSTSVDQAVADWFYYIEMGNPLGGTNGYGYDYTIPTRAAYAAEYYAQFHS